MSQTNWPQTGYGPDDITISYHRKRLWKGGFSDYRIFSEKPRPKIRLQLRIPWNEEEWQPIPTGPWRSGLHWRMWPKMPRNQIHFCCVGTQQWLWKRSWCENMEGETSGNHCWVCHDVRLNWIELNLLNWIELNWIQLNWIEWNEMDWIVLHCIELNYIKSKYVIIYYLSQKDWWSLGV